MLLVRQYIEEVDSHCLGITQGGRQVRDEFRGDSRLRSEKVKIIIFSHLSTDLFLAAEPINFVPEGEDHDIYSTFLDVLKKCKFSKGKPEKGKTKLHNLKMKEEDLAKVFSGDRGNSGNLYWVYPGNNILL